MSKEKQIEEMAFTICKGRLVSDDKDGGCKKCRQDGNCLYQEIAYSLYNAGYRKQIEGEWLKPTIIGGRTFNDLPHCSVCGDVPCEMKKHCANCGAEMKGGEGDVRITDRYYP